MSAQDQARSGAAGLKSRILIFTEADHAFFNDSGARFNAPAAAEAYRQTLRRFGRFMVGGRSHRGSG
jgi:carboxymethylenebutenolidase